MLPSVKSEQEESANRNLPKKLQRSNSSWVSWLTGSSKVINGDGHAYAVPMNKDILKSGERYERAALNGKKGVYLYVNKRFLTLVCFNGW
jgi:hypothetical protein